VTRTFTHFGLDEEKDSLSKYKIQIWMVQLMHKNYDFQAWNNLEFNATFNLFEEDEDNGQILSDKNDEGLDRSEYIKLIKRCA